MAVVYLGLGANLNQPVQQLEQAVAALGALVGKDNIVVSRFYSSKPMGPQDQPDYVNAVAKITTLLAPLALLDQTQKIELDCGRVRKEERWGPRTLDIDILLYDNEIINNERLTVPHYGLELREFVLYPLAELDTDLILPNGKPIAALLNLVPLNGLTPITR
ncbi:2-amino-4-hydroxy-6-hydroxymethyldihydropteridine diphosphokinase [Pseudoalteromonas tunicata]|jgi:2-amino-4-hydroxy-6-hydroxymethyldihydropteridine diphosphokinase|uniref:2-amino-4-hydroxy-6-hydroxymethyldihydropteridine pyrophosphokinase n=1 Tax=Pseudoalteromonas tunicata D2 TaxID=87626 RepID=A4C747_9GAMM|nr:2-amino-4-hydroxy-6-hydroxymethyldihydropteridine diphosphokinase [Pseudoalteromonas tunicata]ATC95772.1 2-amino-4-hydroxy-6-hydroxymethyldihydropteridine diphosphokinase [Pseudoalteromonas tunicata]AXT31320.1 2-amino-4-hydroxy-6-hydroxymethyldihydropteridine diphosphokinase [Pseudoalteromonas tunicata]EAR29801.1 2-amino-4-hydroxy-6-hydroxymethyldihyropteridine pyrophosphokinase [Pseudoalteromonas tunicata D2]